MSVIGQLAKKVEKLRGALLAYHLLNRIKNDQEQELFDKAEQVLSEQAAATTGT